jgi:hypothetical protein
MCRYLSLVLEALAGTSAFFFIHRRRLCFTLAFGVPDVKIKIIRFCIEK